MNCSSCGWYWIIIILCISLSINLWRWPFQSIGMLLVWRNKLNETHIMKNTNLFKQFPTGPVQRIYIEIGKIVNIFEPVSPCNHAEAVTQTRKTNAAIWLDKNVASFDITKQTKLSLHLYALMRYLFSFQTSVNQAIVLITFINKFQQLSPAVQFKCCSKTRWRLTGNKSLKLTRFDGYNNKTRCKHWHYFPCCMQLILLRILYVSVQDDALGRIQEMICYIKQHKGARLYLTFDVTFVNN